MVDTFAKIKCESREGRLTLQQEDKLKQYATAIAGQPRTNPSLLPWLAFFLDTGTRPGEATRIELSWVDFGKRQINVPKRGTKTKNQRVIMFDAVLEEVLKERYSAAQAAGSKYLFWSYSHGKNGKKGGGRHPVQLLQQLAQDLQARGHTCRNMPAHWQTRIYLTAF